MTGQERATLISHGSRPIRSLKMTLESLEGHSSITIKPDLTRECIILRDATGKNISDYKDTAVTRVMRENLVAINEFYQKHHIDLRIKDIRLQETVL